MAAGVGEKLAGAASWFCFAGVFLSTLFAILAITFLLILVTDPFDRGHGMSLLSPGVLDESPRTANVSRGRDPRFNAAVFGNSHVQLLDPERLSDADFRFVQMSTPGTGPREQAVLMRWFMRNHRGIRAMVVGIDSQWCGQDPNIKVAVPFPFWLYGDDFNYFTHVVGTRSLDHGWRRIRIAAGRSPVTDPAGYWNYESGRQWDFHPALPQRPPIDLSPAYAAGLNFPALDQIESVLAQLPEDTLVVLVMPPVLYTSLPAPDSAVMRQMTGCKYDVLRRAAGRHWRFVDFYFDTPLSHDPENFWDASHVRMNVARAMEMSISEKLSQRSDVER
jgi:hypothetical protein